MVQLGWVEAHGIPIRPLTEDKPIWGANNSPIELIGVIDIRLRMASNLEFEVHSIPVSPSDGYQALIGNDILQGFPGVLSPATILMPSVATPGLVTWYHEGIESVAKLIVYRPPKKRN